MTDSPGLVAQNLSCRRDDRLLFESLSFGVKPGEILEICGPNGSGKTTLLRILAGLRQADTGDITWHGRNTRKDTDFYRSQFCFLGHLNGLKADLSPYENLRAEMALFAQQDVSIDAALAKLGLKREADTPTRRLSAGQKQRTSLARLLIRASRLWILDEPCASLDQQAQQQIQDIIEAHALDGGSVVFTTHQPISFRAIHARQLWLQEAPHA